MAAIRIGAWLVNPSTGEISRPGQSLRLDARTLRLLLHLAQRAGEVVSIEDALDHVWAGVIVTPDSVYQAVAALRRMLGDDARQPTYIVTVPRLGYRLVAPVTSPAEPTAAADAPASLRNRPLGALLAAGAALCLAFAAALLLQTGAVRSHQDAGSGVPQYSVAVLPFLDLTSQAMDQEYFADGMTEELIDRLSQVPNLHVPAPTASFFFKGKKMTIRAMAQAMGVAYVLDGSLRKSNGTLRVAARLVRAADGYVVWSKTFNQSIDDELKVQDDIAGAVTQALVTAMR